MTQKPVARRNTTAVRYKEVEAGCDLDLSDNTNLWGSPPSVQRTIANVAALSRYPSAYSEELKRSLANAFAVDGSNIVVGCGSDDILDSALRSLAESGDKVALLDPTFSMMREFAAVSGLGIIPIDPLSPTLVDDFMATGAQVTYLCTPNNPTGAVLDPVVIENIVSEAKGIVIIDEAYAEFAGASSVALLERFDNILITRTMSKAYGLAGLRIGFGIGSPDTIARVEAARGPYKLTTISERVAIAVLENDGAWVRGRVADAIEVRERLIKELTRLGRTPLPSGANFVMIPVVNAEMVERELRADGIAVRAFNNLRGIGDAIRVTVGPWPAMERFIASLRTIE
jgi:histidinol-phosphate aminotransferase